MAGIRQAIGAGTLIAGPIVATIMITTGGIGVITVTRPVTSTRIRM